MFYHDIKQGINAFSQATFVNDEISLELNPIAAFFLTHLGNFDCAFSCNKGCISLKGLTLKKNDVNSIGDVVNPKFITKLNKKTACFINCLTSNWSETAKEDTLVTIYNPCNSSKTISYPLLGINKIIEVYKLSDKIKLITPNSLNYQGKWSDILKFTHVLRCESILTHQNSTINLLMCIKNAAVWYHKHQIPNELIDKIVMLISFLLVPHPINKPLPLPSI